MLIGFTLIVMAIVAYYHWHEGLFNAACLCFCVFFSGLFTFNFWEPMAGWIESMINNSPLQGYEDFLSMIILFCVALGLLRALTNALNNNEIEYQPMANQIGGGAIALITGYLLIGFLICAMETLPWGQNFLGFEPYSESESKVRSIMPPDRVWLALMHRAGKAALARSDGKTFDPEGAFEGNYLRNRRTSEGPAEGAK
jgi:hypothetical protein